MPSTNTAGSGQPDSSDATTSVSDIDWSANAFTSTDNYHWNGTDAWITVTSGTADNNSEQEEITKKIESGVHELHRGFTIRAAMAEAMLRPAKIDDVYYMDFIVYDSRSGITDKPNSVVAEGMPRLIGKNVRYRHVDPNKNAYSLVGEVQPEFQILHKMAENGQVYMQVIFPIKIDVISEKHAKLVDDLRALEAEKKEIGSSMGWVETPTRFLPHELSITPDPLCKTCVNTGTGQLMSASAEGKDNMSEEDKSDKGNNSMTDDKPTEKDKKPSSTPSKENEMLVNQGIEIKELKAEVAELKGELKTSTDKSDKLLASKEADNKELTEKIAQLKEDKRLAETLPIRTEIAENLIGLKDEEAKAKIESLASQTAEDLLSFKDDLSKASIKTEQPGEGEEPETPYLAGSDLNAPLSGKEADLDLAAEKWMAEAGVDIKMGKAS